MVFPNNIDIYNAKVGNEFARKEFVISGNNNDYDDGGTFKKEKCEN